MGNITQKEIGEIFNLDDSTIIFMEANIQGWVPPWKDFSTYLK